MSAQLNVTPALLKQAHALLKERTREKTAFTPMDANGPQAGGAPGADPSQGEGAPAPGGPGGPGSPPPPGGDPAAAAGQQPVTVDMLQQMLPQAIQQAMMSMGGGMPGAGGGAGGGGGGGGKGGGKSDQMLMIQHDIAEIKNQVNQLFAFLTGMQMKDPDGSGGGGEGAPAGMGAGVDPAQGPEMATMPEDPSQGAGAPPPAQGAAPGMQVQAALREIIPPKSEKRAAVANGRSIAATIARLQKPE